MSYSSVKINKHKSVKIKNAQYAHSLSKMSKLLEMLIYWAK